MHGQQGNDGAIDCPRSRRARKSPADFAPDNNRRPRRAWIRESRGDQAAKNLARETARASCRPPPVGCKGSEPPMCRIEPTARPPARHKTLYAIASWALPSLKPIPPSSLGAIVPVPPGESRGGVGPPGQKSITKGMKQQVMGKRLRLCVRPSSGVRQFIAAFFRVAALFGSSERSEEGDESPHSKTPKAHEP